MFFLLQQSPRLFGCDPRFWTVIRNARACPNRAPSRRMWAIRAGEQVLSRNDSRERTGEMQTLFREVREPSTCYMRNGVTEERLRVRRQDFPPPSRETAACDPG